MEVQFFDCPFYEYIYIYIQKSKNLIFCERQLYFYYSQTLVMRFKIFKTYTIRIIFELHYKSS